MLISVSVKKGGCVLHEQSNKDRFKITITMEKGKSDEDLEFIRGFKSAFWLFMECMKWKLSYAVLFQHSPLKLRRTSNVFCHRLFYFWWNIFY